MRLRTTHPLPEPARPVPGAGHRARRLAAVAVATLAALLLLPAAASAHAELVSSDPRDGSRLESAPGRVVLTFTEPVDLGPGHLRVFAPDGRRVEIGAPRHLDGQGATATVNLRTGLGDGTYTVVWLVVSADSHPIRGAFTFVVGEPSDVAPTVLQQTGGGDRLIGPLLGVARWLAFGGFALLVGCLAFLLVCWPAGADVAAVRQVAVTGWSALLAGTVGQAVLQGPYTAGLGIAQALDGKLLATTVATRLGHALMIRIGLLGVIGALGETILSRVPAATPRRRLWFGAGAAVMAVALAATWSAADHASTGIQVALALPADVLHMIAMAVWLGGLVVLAAVVLPRGEPQVIGEAVRRFSRVALGCVAVLVLTGTYQAWRQTGSVGALTGTEYGEILTVKVGLVVVLVCIAAISREWVRSRVAGAAGGTGEPRALRRSVAAETALAAAVLAVTALLVNTAPARTAYGPPAAADTGTTDTGTTDTVINGAADFRAGPGPANAGSVTVFLDPGRVGVNILHVTVWDTKSVPRAVPEVRATFTEPSRRIGPLPVRLTSTGPGQYISPSTQIPSAGDWRLDVAVRTTDVDETTVSFPMKIRSSG